MEKEKRYEANVGCYNCGKTELVSIPKGITVEAYKENKICSNCGCKLDGSE
jgi:transcription elongation factor Elf1